MFKSLVFLIAFVFMPQSLKAQRSESDKSVIMLLAQLQRSGEDTTRIHLLNRLGEFYILKNGEYKEDLDKAMAFLNQSLLLCDQLHSSELKNEALLLKGDCFLERGDLSGGRACFMQVINFYRQKGSLINEAQTWSRWGQCIRGTVFGESENEKLQCYQNALLLFEKLHENALAADVSRYIADVHMNEGKLELAERELLNILSKYKPRDYKKRAYVFDLLSVISGLKGNPDKQLYYNLEAIKALEAAHVTVGAPVLYSRLAETYASLKMYNNAVINFRIAINFGKRVQWTDMVYELTAEMTKSLVFNGQTKLALKELQNLSHEMPPSNLMEKYALQSGFAYCYENIGALKRAEYYYLEAIKSSDSLRLQDKIYLNQYANQLKKTSNFFVLTRQYQKAAFYLQKIQTIPKGIIGSEDLTDLELLQFKIDSAAGRLISAINHYELHKKLYDSIFSAKKSKQIQELQIRFEANEKDKRIQDLKNKTLLQENQAVRTRVIRNIMLCGFALLILLFAAGYNRYRLKQRNNLHLIEKQLEITAKNATLERLLDDNRWLLREVHHRVKNNLQVVMSLLNSQAAYLSDETALNAVMESQHRVHAMSLIHQKLYRANSLATIFMPDYIHDLLDYLKESFHVMQDVYFEIEVDPVSLDVIQAIPVGLVLNEIITNALKYAFPYSAEDRISVSFLKMPDDQISLIVSDNGRGLPDGFDTEAGSSFGMTLIKGLVEDLEGALYFEGQSGTTVSITFTMEPV